MDNHGSGLGRGARLELLDDQEPAHTDTHTGCSDSPVDVDRGNVDCVHRDSSFHAHEAANGLATPPQSSGPSSTGPSSALGPSPGTASSTTEPSSPPALATRPLFPVSDNGPQLAPSRPGVMTRLQRGIRQVKQRTDGTIAWSAARTPLNQITTVTP